MVSNCPRTQASLALKDVLADGQSLTASLELYTQSLSPKDIALCKALAYGTLRYYFSLSLVVDELISKPLRKKDYDIKALLLVGAYQLQYMRLPDYAAINSCVEACKKLKKNWAKGMVNAILRQVQRAEQTPSEHHEHPQWLAGKIQKAWPEQASDIFTANNNQAPLCLRVNTQQTSRAALAQELSKQDTENHTGQLSEDALYLDTKPHNITELYGFEEGLFSVQDEAAQMCASLLAPEDNATVLDACAAPGGKTCHLLEHYPSINLIAADIDGERLERIEQNLERLDLQATVMQADVGDAQSLAELPEFDAILADVPCSATGVIRRHPDIKLLRQADDIKELVSVQAEVLNTLWQKLKPGGILLYTTCSILPEENHRQIANFLEAHSNAQAIDIELSQGFASGAGWQLLPQIDGHDGFFYAKLQKQAC